MKVSHDQIEQWSDQVARIRACTTREQVGAMYEEIVGYDSTAEHETADFEQLQAEALDYMREVCHAFELHVSTIGL